MNEHEILVLAGPGGSKSTFVWGLYNHINHEHPLHITYRGVEGDVSEDFRDGVIEPMSKRREYPGQTLEGYVIEFEVGDGSTLRSGLTFNFIDYPGERIGDVLRPIMDEIRDGDIDWDQVHTEFETDLKQKIGGDEQVGYEEWKTIIKHYYDNATKIIFLLNIYKLYVEGESLVYEAEDLRTVTENKVRVALVPTAIDLIGYDADDADFKTGGGLFGLSPQMIDEELLDSISSQITDADSPGVANIWSEIEMNEQIDFFGTAVPAENMDSDKIQAGEQGPIKTQGFDQVVKWLRD